MMLKNMLNSASPAVLGLLLGGTALLGSCAKEDQAGPAPAVSATKTDHHTGEELYRGIFFFEGEVAAKIPAFDSYRASINKGLAQNPAFPAARRRNIDAIVGAVRALDPTYFDRLQQAIQSRDFQRVKAALKQGTLLNEAVTLSALPSPGQKQAYLQRKQVLRGLDMTRYDFSREQDIARYVQDARAALTASGQLAPSAQIQDEAAMIMVYQSGDYVAYQSVSVFIAEVAHAFFEKLQEESTANQLTFDLVIRQIALNL
ncbi:hypothetical protein E5K00_09545 [Hymenobacter aquaticus]|uniref:SdpC family antimicrobial peptide n=1 Tax=Hymenobacter aquaticus TaxID=1867101 RepID=A0A4Z0Q9L1_9BACT|nr:hypothetical protein [Hymenobacter aquaticus]TGE25412.1 hypothetical protein E5K00_09545 [Hymenobacter aquaticus]